jgi:hypothetical protein
MTDHDDDIESPERQVRADTEKIADEAGEAATPELDPDRDAARQIFDRIKAARERAAKKRD